MSPIARALFFGISVFIISVPSHAYLVGVDGQALKSGDPNSESYIRQFTDGVTSVSYDTGLINAGNALPGGSARSSGSVNLAEATLRTYAEGNTTQNAISQARFVDTLFFDLPDGTSTADVAIDFIIEGSFTGDWGGKVQFGQLVWGIAESVDLLTVTLPTTLSLTQTVSEGIGYNLQAELAVGGAPTFTSQDAVADFGNTGYFDISMPDGVTFTSDSGVFYTDPYRPSDGTVPTPPTLILLGIGLAGLGWSRRKRN